MKLRVMHIIADGDHVASLNVDRPNEGTVIYVRVLQPLSIDGLRRWWADGWRFASWAGPWYTFSMDLGRDKR